MKRNLIFNLGLLILVLVVSGIVLYSVQRVNQPEIAPAAGEKIVPVPAPAAPAAPATTPATPTVDQDQAATPTAVDQKILIQITADGFVPKTQKVRRGAEVTFVNNDSSQHWPASDLHPVHRDCPGFDAEGGLALAEQYAFKYSYDRDCHYHDHLNPRLRGKLELE